MMCVSLCVDALADCLIWREGCVWLTDSNLFLLTGCFFPEGQTGTLALDFQNIAVLYSLKGYPLFLG